MAEWLRRWTANPLGSARVGSNPILVGFLLLTQSHQIKECADIYTGYIYISYHLILNHSAQSNHTLSSSRSSHNLPNSIAFIAISYHIHLYHHGNTNNFIIFTIQTGCWSLYTLYAIVPHLTFEGGCSQIAKHIKCTEAPTFCKIKVLISTVTLLVQSCHSS